MTALLTLAQAQALLPGSTLVGDGATAFGRVHSDTRTLRAGDLFVALRGERFDANDFLAQAKVSGAVDHVVTEYEVAGGALVHAEGAWCFTPGFGFNMSYTVNFERATVDYDLARGADALKVCEAGQPAQVLKLGQPDGYVGELRHFVECCVSGAVPTVVTADDGVSSLEICEAEEKSIQTGLPVALP